MGQGSFHSCVVPGLDVLIGDPSFLTPNRGTKKKADILYIPSFYIYRVLDFFNEQTSRGEACRELTAIFGTITEEMNRSGSDIYTFENGMTMKFRDFPENPFFRGIPHSSEEKYTSSKFHAIAIAKTLQRDLDKDSVAIMTGSDQLATLATFNRIDVARINPEVYTGRIQVSFPDDYASYWWTNRSIPKQIWDELFPNRSLVVNQYVELLFNPCGQIDSSYQNIGRFNGEAIVPLRFTKINHPAFSKFYPKTPGQAMLFDALLAPVDELPIVIASGTFGTGKTFCAVAAALAQVLDKQYDRIFVCPRDGALGREIGFLKGDKIEKILPQAAPILDNLESVVRLMNIGAKSYFIDECESKRGKRNSGTPDFASIKATVEEYRKRYFEFEPVIYMGGRSIENSFMIFDEFQDMERGQARALLSRIGNGSKIVILGDPSQTTNPHLNKTSNGLSYSASKLAGDPLVAVVSFNESSEIVRSDAAKHIAKKLSSHNFIHT